MMIRKNTKVKQGMIYQMFSKIQILFLSLLIFIFNSWWCSRSAGTGINDQGKAVVNLELKNTNNGFEVVYRSDEEWIMSLYRMYLHVKELINCVVV